MSVPVPAVKKPPAKLRKRPVPRTPQQPDFMPTLFGLDYSTYGAQPTNFLVSFILHSLAVIGIIAITTYVLSHRQEIKATVTQVFTADISPYVLPPAKTQAGGGGGGGDRDKLAASKGALPKLSTQQVTPPMVVVRN